MNCKFCNAELEDGVIVCPQCGKELSEESDQETTLCCEERAANAVEETEETANTEGKEIVKSDEETLAFGNEETVDDSVVPLPKKNIGRIILVAVCGVLLLGILTIAVLIGSGIDISELNIGPRGEGILFKNSYSVNDNTAVKKADKKVAVCNGQELTNAELQAHYFGNMYQFMSSYGTGYFDYNSPLDTQEFTGADMTWQQYFSDAAITNWHRYQVLNALAEAEGFTADHSEMETLRQELEAAAVQYGFENVDAMIQHDMGAGCDIDSYISYVSLTESVNQYVSHLYENWKPTLEDLESYYSANEEAFIQGGLSKDSGPIVDVRHILIMPKGEAVDGTYTEAQWADALKEAERILALWESGEKTEESFAALANEYSEDGGSKANGGLYQGITPDASFVENFLNWSVDESRTTGDTGIVETEFGYHIMYFVTGEPIWMTAARDNYLPYKLNLVIEENMDRWPLEVTYRNIIVTDANVSE